MATDPLTASVSPDELPDATASIHLVERAQGGDDAALDELLRRYQDRLLRVVRIKLGAGLRRYMDSMDIVQETYKAAYQDIGSLTPRGGASILNWLTTIALNRIRDAHDYHFAQKRDRRREVPMDARRPGDDSAPAAIVPPADDTAPDERAWLDEVREILDAAVAELAEADREVVLLRDYLGGEWEWVAEQLGKPTVGAARQHHQRAWIKLRRAVRPKLEGRA